MHIHTILQVQVLVILIINHLVLDIWKYKDRYDLCTIFIQTIPSVQYYKQTIIMQLKIVSALAFVTLVAAAGPSGPTILPPFPGNPLPTVRKSNCNSGQLACCRFTLPRSLYNNEHESL